MHINVVVPGYDNAEAQAEVGDLLEPFIFDYVRDKAGSVSAEHGIGFTKPQYLRHSKSEESVNTMVGNLIHKTNYI